MNMRSSKKHAQKGRHNNQRGAIIAVAGAVFIIGITIGLTLNQNSENGHANESVPVTYSLGTMNVSKQFACSCGSCGEKNLAVCTCPTALTTKKFIEMNLQGGINKEEVEILVKDIYGHYTG